MNKTDIGPKAGREKVLLVTVGLNKQIKINLAVVIVYSDSNLNSHFNKVIKTMVLKLFFSHRRPWNWNQIAMLFSVIVVFNGRCDEDDFFFFFATHLEKSWRIQFLIVSAGCWSVLDYGNSWNTLHRKTEERNAESKIPLY